MRDTQRKRERERETLSTSHFSFIKYHEIVGGVQLLYRSCLLLAKEGCYAFLPCYLDILALLCAPAGRLALSGGWRNLCCRLGRASCKSVCTTLDKKKMLWNLFGIPSTWHNKHLADVVLQTCTAMHMQLHHQAGRAAPRTLFGLRTTLCHSLRLARRGWQSTRACRCCGSLGIALIGPICILPNLLSHFLALVIVRFARDLAPLASCRPGQVSLKA